MINTSQQPHRRADFANVLADLLDFVEEKVAEAIADPSFQMTAIEEAAGAIPVMHDRLREDHYLLTRFVFRLGVRIEPRRWREWWTAFAKMEREKFLREADELVGPDGPLSDLKTLLQAHSGG